MQDHPMRILAGSASQELGARIAMAYGVPLCATKHTVFSDGEFRVSIEETVRGKEVVIVQSTFPPSDNLMELLMLVDAAKRASAKRIVAVLPYFGFARQDRKDAPRVAIGAKLIANMLTAAGVDRVITMDLHADQIQGFFDIPTDNLFAAPVFVEDIKMRFGKNEIMVVSPDVGGVVRTRALGNRIGADLAIVDKRREKAGVSEVMNIIGDVAGRHRAVAGEVIGLLLIYFSHHGPGNF